MKKDIKLVSKILLIILAPLFVQAAEVVVCDNQPQPHLQAVFEARQIYHLDVSQPFSTLKENNQFFSDKMAPLINMSSADVKGTLGSIYSRFKFSKIQKEKVLDPHCKIKTISEDDANDNIQIDQELWQKLSGFEQSALLFQETFAARNTDWDRKFIAHLFSKTELMPVMQNLPTEHLLCSGGAYDTSMLFYVYAENNGVRFQFWSLAGHSTFVWTSVFVPGFNYSWLLSANSASAVGQADHLKTQSQIYSDVPIKVTWDVQKNQRKLNLSYQINGKLETSAFSCE